MHQNVFELAGYRQKSTSEEAGGDILKKECDAVDSCIQYIDNLVDRFMSERLKKLYAFVIEAVLRESGLEENFHRLIFSDCDVARLQQEIISGLKREILRNDYQIELEPQPVEIHVSALADVFCQTERVLKISRIASLIGQWGAEIVAEQVFDRIAVKELIDYTTGNRLKIVFQELRQREEAHCLNGLESSVEGLLMGIGSQIKEKLSFKVAVAIYGLSEKDVHGCIQRNASVESNDQELSA